jgi:hypothetical protein
MFDLTENRYFCDTPDDSVSSDWQAQRYEVAGDGACTECNCPRFISGGHDNICQLATCHHTYRAHQ